MDIITLALAKKMIKRDTPKKGIDYFTEEDKQELVQEVITALPKYNGETSEKP